MCLLFILTVLIIIYLGPRFMSHDASHGNHPIQMYSQRMKNGKLKGIFDDKPLEDDLGEEKLKHALEIREV